MNPDAISNTRPGMAMMPMRVNRVRINAIPTKASWANSSGPSPLSSFFENIGTKAMLNAPSAKKRRNMLGRENATKKASAAGPEPRYPATITSRINPMTRLRRVHIPTVKKPDIRRIGFIGMLAL